MNITTACVVILLCTATAFAGDGPIVVTPHPQAGKFRAQRDPDRPILAYYGGVGLRKMPDGTWNGYRQSSSEDVRYLIDRLRENGITRAYASIQEEAYPSAIAPPEESAPDYTKQFIELAHQNNIEVYGDIACFANFLERCRGFTAAHPEAFTRDQDGRADTHMLSPAHEHVRRFKRALLMEYVQNYPVDGLALDFIRYPYYSHDLRIGYGKHGYDEPALRKFAESTGSTEPPEPDDPRWIAIKARYVSEFIRELRSDLKASGINLPLAAFNSTNFSRDDAMRTVHQDWLTWENEQLIDEHAPMVLMTFGMVNLIGATGDLVNIPQRKSIVMGPIFIDAGFDPAAGIVPSPERIKDAARRLIKLGCDGLWFCRASEIEQHDLWPVVKEISQWSISEIRAEPFDPAYENLLTNGNFDSDLSGWTTSGRAAVETVDGRRQLVLDATTDAAEVSQEVRFVSHGYLAVHALQVGLRGIGEEAIPARLDLQYVDGATETHALSLPTTGEHKTIAVGCDFKKHVLSRATLTIKPPRGQRLIVKQVELLRDPRPTR